MAAPTKLGSMENDDSISNVAISPQEKNMLVSYIVEGSSVVRVVDERCSVIHELEDHRGEILVQAWVSGDTLVTIDTSGEARTWSFRGKQVVAGKLKDSLAAPTSITALEPGKHVAHDFVVALSSGKLARVQDSKVISQARPVDGRVVTMDNAKGRIACLVLPPGRKELALVTLDSQLNVLKEETIGLQIALDDMRHARLLLLDEDSSIVVAIGEDGKLISWTDGKTASEEMGAAVACIDAKTKAILTGTRGGEISILGLKRGKFTRPLLAFTAHDFRVTAIDYHGAGRLLVTGGMDGIITTWRLPENVLNVSTEATSGEGMSWQDKERAEGKLALVRDSLDKGQVAKARAVLKEVKASDPRIIKELAGPLAELEARLNDLSTEMAALEDKRTRLKKFLDKVSETRGDIFLTEIAENTGLPKKELVALIKELQGSMEWEFIEQQECLFLFSRTSLITAVTPVERGHRGGLSRLGKPGGADRGGSGWGSHYETRPSPRGDRSGRKDGDSPSGASTPAARVTISPVLAALWKKANVPEEDQATIKEQSRRLIDTTRAIFIGKKREIEKEIGIGELASTLEEIGARIKYIILDGIISPRIVEDAMKKGVLALFGRRLHPRIEIESLRLPCIEFDQIDPIMGVGTRGSAKGGDGGEASRAPRAVVTKTAGIPLSPKEVETLLSTVLDEKWKKLEDLLLEAGINEDMDLTLAKIKLKQFVDKGKAEKDVFKGQDYYKKRR